MGVSLPQELTDKIIDEVAKDSVLRTATLQASSLVSRAWVHRSHKHLFSNVEFDDGRFHDWCSSVRPGEDGPSRHVTSIHYRADYCDAYPHSLVDDGRYLSYFTNVQTLHLSGVGLHLVEYVFGFMRLRSTIRSIELDNCRMNINDLVAFLRPFTNLENLSLWAPYAREDTKLEERGRLPTLKGQLDLDLFPRTGTWSLMRELSLLPLAFCDITLRDRAGLLGTVNELLMASRRTLTMIRVLDRRGDFIDLRNFDMLEGVQLHASSIRYIPPILQTITSSKFVAILLSLSDGDLKGHLEHPQDWAQLDLELCFLADRIHSARSSSGGGDGWRLRVKFFVTSPVSNHDFRKCAKILLPESRKHVRIIITGELVW